MMLRLVARAFTAHPVRAVVLACGFGFGIAVMAALLGVGEVVLEQAQAPALRGGVARLSVPASLARTVARRNDPGVQITGCQPAT